MLASLLLVLSVAAAPSAPYDVKGVSLGMSLDELKATLGPNLKCDGPAVDPDEDEFAPIFCRVKVPGRSALEDLGKLDDTFAGRPTQIYYWIWNERVGMISFAALNAAEFDEIVDVMKTKYSEPAEVVTEIVRTGDNAEHEDKRVTWRGGGVIEFRKLAPINIRRSTLSFYSDEYWTELERRRAERTKHAEQDI